MGMFHLLWLCFINQELGEVGTAEGDVTRFLDNGLQKGWWRIHITTDEWHNQRQFNSSQISAARVHNAQEKYCMFTTTYCFSRWGMPDRSLGQEVWILGKLHTQLQLLRYAHDIISHQIHVRAFQGVSRLVITSMPSNSYHRYPSDFTHALRYCTVMTTRLF